MRGKCQSKPVRDNGRARRTHPIIPAGHGLLWDSVAGPQDEGDDDGSGDAADRVKVACDGSEEREQRSEGVVADENDDPVDEEGAGIEGETGHEVDDDDEDRDAWDAKGEIGEELGQRQCG